MSIANLRKCLIIFLFLLPQTLQAWNGTGHMLVAEVAYKKLDPITIKNVDKLLAKVHTVYNQVDSFTTAGPWADDIKGHAIKFLDSWHYLDTPFSTDGTPLDQVEHNPQHVVWMISKARTVLLSKTANDVEKATALLFLIHCVGDVHQPLHSSTRVTKDYPTGDRGGNSFKLRGKYRNLHSLWDSGLGTMRYLKRPLSPNDKTWLSNYATTITANYPLHEQELASSVVNWSVESFTLSRDRLYVNIEANQAPTASYINENQPMAEQRLAYAGQRLGNMLNCIYGGASCVEVGGSS